MRARKFPLVFFLTLLQLFPCHARPEEAAAQQPPRSRPFTVEDFIRVKTITSTQISPDGTRVLFTIEEADARINQRPESIWLIPTRGGAQATKLQELFAALKRNNVAVEYLIYNKQGLGINDPAQQADIIRRNLDWFNRWLKAKSPWMGRTRRV
jgi:dipeptidyl aminopeptidase/acylaminoacyl peptidase